MHNENPNSRQSQKRTFFSNMQLSSIRTNQTNLELGVGPIFLTTNLRVFFVCVCMEDYVTGVKLANRNSRRIGYALLL